MALLDDLFGIQSRGGCSCAGPYGHRLLGIDIERSRAFERQIGLGCEGIKPGWVRVNFNYFISEPVFEFILEAVALVAREGWRLLPHVSLRAGQRDVAPRRRRRRTGPLAPRHHLRRRPGWPIRPSAAASRSPDWRTTSTEARRLLAAPPAPPSRPQGPDDLEAGPDFEALRWFTLPAEAADELRAEAGTTVPASEPGS